MLWVGGPKRLHLYQPTYRNTTEKAFLFTTDLVGSGRAALIPIGDHRLPEMGVCGVCSVCEVLCAYLILCLRIAKNTPRP